MSEGVQIAFAILLTGAIGWLALWIRAHEVGCREREEERAKEWAQLMVEHGRLEANVERLMRREDMR